MEYAYELMTQSYSLLRTRKMEYAYELMTRFTMDTGCSMLMGWSSVQSWSYTPLSLPRRIRNEYLETREYSELKTI